MPIANVTLNNTFDEWRTVTNQVISFVNDVDGGNLTKFYSNSEVLTVTENVARGGKNYITLNVSSDVFDTSTLNVATANAVNIVFSAIGSSEARITLVSDNANVINAVANAAFIQANIARNHANAAFTAANVGSGLGAAFTQANTARVHANTAHATANAGIEQANTARVHANTAHETANAGLLQANTARVHANAGLLQANTARIHANVGFEQANTARDHANAGFEQANTAYNRANTAYDIAILASGNVAPVLITTNAAFTQANTARDHANVSFEQANTARVHANVGFEQANTARVHANAGLLQANTARIHANVAFEQANTARNHANAAFANANVVMISTQSSFTVANSAFLHANAVGAIANAGIATGNAAFGQANTARDHANTAHASANAGLVQANTARIHANTAFERANAALPNTSGVSFAGNLSFPTGNITIGEGATQGIRLHVHSWSDTANIFPEIEAMSGTQRLMFNSNTSVGAWNDLMSNRDLAIIYTRGTSDDGANLIIGPWTDSSFGYKQDGLGRHGFNTINPQHVIDANGSANISGSLFVGVMNVVSVVESSFGQANTARIHANAAHASANAGLASANAGLLQANTARVHANAGLAQANTARDHANAAHASANAGLLQANTARVHANAGFEQANTARNHANAAFLAANTGSVAVLAFAQANTARDAANTASPLGQQTIWVPSVGMYSRTSNGPIIGSVETNTNKVMIRTLDFDASTIEYAQFAIQMPKSWNEGTLVCQFVWSHPTTTTNFGVVWAIQAVAFANDNAADTAFGTAQGVADVGGTANNIYITDETSAITVAGAPGPEEYVVFQIWRNVADANDNMAVDARLHGVKIHYTIDAAKDD